MNLHQNENQTARRANLGSRGPHISLERRSSPRLPAVDERIWAGLVDQRRRIHHHRRSYRKHQPRRRPNPVHLRARRFPGPLVQGGESALQRLCPGHRAGSLADPRRGFLGAGGLLRALPRPPVRRSSPWASPPPRVNRRIWKTDAPAWHLIDTLTWRFVGSIIREADRHVAASVPIPAGQVANRPSEARASAGKRWVLGLFGRAKNLIKGLGTLPEPTVQYYNVVCPLGHRVRGQRTEGYQALRCPACGEGVFVLPMSPLPEPVAPPRATPKRERAAPSQRGRRGRAGRTP